MAFVAGSSFAGASVKTERSVCTGRTVMKMSADSDVTRRQLLLGALAAMVPAAALAKGGDSPKYSIFGGESQSSPFVYMDQRKGNAVYQALNDEELAEITKSLAVNRARLEETGDFIDVPSWDDVRSLVRLEMYDTRRNVKKIHESLDDPKRVDRAEKVYAQLKKDIEALDYACVVKDQAMAKKARASALKSFDSWVSTVGVSI
uniref:Uncharacterized protein n=1 Tax=Rhodosorus marinus TaxID=101924 RepID=A0A7S0G5Z7_9RHOD|mmetsp:Transcript_22756/g.32756  ORF Transcript_22756/g.32756 Transcript_22756/m.32756 type:complete len:204 (+) Transcript_22756:136-747(+)